MPLPDPLPIRPFARPVAGEARVPGSKSLTNRALLLAALARGPVSLEGALFSEDTHLMAAALRKLGFGVSEDPIAGTLRVDGQGGVIPADQADLFVGLAGTAARFLTALCAAAPRGTYRLDGVPQMRKRPMRGLIEALRALGADIRCTGQEGFFPLEIRAKGLRGGPVRIDAAESSQMLSALLMVAPLASAPVEVAIDGPVRMPFVRMTARLLEAFGQPAPDLGEAGGALRIRNGIPYARPSGVYPIEPDATAASYFLALPLVAGGRIAIPGLHGPADGLQGDSRFAEVLSACGMTVNAGSSGVEASFAPGSVRRGVERNFSEFSDTFLTLAAIAPLLEGPTRITGIAHTRKQETDRIEAMATELRKIVGKANIATGEDSLEIRPGSLDEIRKNVRLSPGGSIAIDTYGDHRVAMSFGVLGSFPLFGDDTPWLRINDPACCAKTFPAFFELLESMRQKSLA